MISHQLEVSSPALSTNITHELTDHSSCHSCLELVLSRNFIRSHADNGHPRYDHQTYQRIQSYFLSIHHCRPAFSKAGPLQAKSLTSWYTVRSLLDDRCNVLPKTSLFASAESRWRLSLAAHEVLFVSGTVKDYPL